MNKEFEIFVDNWHQIVVICSQMTLVLSFLIIAYYALVFTAKRNSPEKYRFMNENEIKYFWYTGLSLSISIGFFLNSLIVRTQITYSVFVLAFKTTISLGIAFAIGYAISTYLNVYYPFRLEKRLSILRFKKRISPQTGKEMRLLNEEYVHLTKEMIENKNLSAYDYDVWIDDETGFKLIEQYAGDLHALLCNNCKFRTLKEYREVLIKKPTYSDSGSVKKFYKCSCCNSLDEIDTVTAPLGT